MKPICKKETEIMNETRDNGGFPNPDKILKDEKRLMKRARRRFLKLHLDKDMGL